MLVIIAAKTELSALLACLSLQTVEPILSELTQNPDLPYGAFQFKEAELCSQHFVSNVNNMNQL